MANHKSALKRIRQTVKRTERNRKARAAMRTYVKRARAAVANGTVETAESELRLAIRKVSKAASKGLIHKKAASRRVSRMTKAFNKLRAAAE